MPAPVAIAVLGAGAIGRRHVERICAEPQARLHAIVDPSPAARAFAQERGLPWRADWSDMLGQGRPDGVIIATPNRLHVEHGLAALAAGLPTLIEKPLAADVAGGQALVDAAGRAGVPLLTGHHRRHNPLARRARAIVESGRLGRLVVAHGVFWTRKPDDYFDAGWRREAGAGPILLNLIHDVDLMRWLCGEIVEVQAMASCAARGFAIEDTAVVTLRFAGGALGTLSASDAAVSPWSWEHTSGENAAYPASGETCLWIAGAQGALAVPRLDLWSHVGAQGWMSDLAVERVVAPAQDPLMLQIRHFCAVIRGEEAPLVSGREGLETLRVVDAIRCAAASGQLVRVAT